MSSVSFLLGSDSLISGASGDWVGGTIKIASPYPISYQPLNKKSKDGKIEVFAHRFSGGYVVRDVFLRREDVSLFARIRESSSKFPIVLKSIVIAPYVHRVKDGDEWVEKILETIYEIDF